MQEVLTLAERAAASDAKVLVTGESGAGKDIVARHVHDHSTRRSAEFVAVNCAGVTETLLESELFGHVKGSFTGAYRDKIGKLRLAHNGTLFLDEVGEMSLRMQALLLRFLENGEIQAVGSDAARATVDVRVIAATNKNLADMVSSGAFREDLLYRLRVIHLHVPSLRERIDRHPPAGHAFLRALGPAGHADRTKRGRRWSATSGRATCASCRTSSSKSRGWRSRPMTRLASTSCRRSSRARATRTRRAANGGGRSPTSCIRRWCTAAIRSGSTFIRCFSNRDITRLRLARAPSPRAERDARQLPRGPRTVRHPGERLQALHEFPVDARLPRRLPRIPHGAVRRAAARPIDPHAAAAARGAEAESPTHGVLARVVWQGPDK